jgi:hypothetical protein
MDDDVITLEHPQHSDRRQFLRAIERMVPDVLVDLRLTADHPAVASFVATSDDRQQSRMSRLLSKVQIKPGPGMPANLPTAVWRPRVVPARHASELLSGDSSECKAAKNVLVSWAVRWCLTDEWLLDFALGTIHEWLNNPANYHLSWWVPTCANSVLTRECPTLTIDEIWHFEPWSVFDQRIQEMLDDFKYRVDMFHQRLGYSGKPSVKMHLEWTALYQCAGLSAAMILKKYQQRYPTTRHSNTIDKAVQEVARRIGLTRRLPKPGRHKSKY